MRVIVVLISTLSAVSSAASESAVPYAQSNVSLDLPFDHAEQLLIPRNDNYSGHAHGGHDHHAQPIAELDETEVTMYHDPTPPSYYWIDLVDSPADETRYPGLMGLHVLSMSLAFFGALPIGIALRSVNNAWHSVSVIIFYVLSALGLSASALYRKSTPDMYDGSKHGLQGYYFLAFALTLSAFDLLSLILRLVTYMATIKRSEKRLAVKTLWTYVILARDECVSGNPEEHLHLVEPEELHEANPEVKDDPEPLAHAAEPIQRAHYLYNGDTAEWVDGLHNRTHRQSLDSQSTTSERTYFGPSDDSLHKSGHVQQRQDKAKRSLLQIVGRATFATAERSLVFAGLIQVITGVVVYTGGCRGSYINACFAHLIKGGIFWCYGLVTFARFLGSFSELGWAWNRAPRHHGVYPTAEFVESLVIFLYGVSNTWMERFGAHPGDPYTTKQVQHISIAVMFWFAGLIGMGIESKLIRRWLAAGATGALPYSQRSAEAVAEPASYAASFNPFPALCIGITGAAMSAHFQTYLFQVQIHMLWGYLLCGFAVMRCLTYFFLWLAPPRSVLPSRPPTEALAAFMLACGGLEFMFSTEELTIAAMRQGRDDVMMFLNVGVAITCLAFCWTLLIISFKGWLKSRAQGALESGGSV